MANLLGFLKLGDECGSDSCGTELVNNCRTLQNVQNATKCGTLWQTTECVDCCCPNFAPSEDETIIDAPWYDANVPASSDFLGLYGTLSLGSSEQNLDPEASAPIKLLTFVGAIMADSYEGAAFGSQWIDRALRPTCSNCKGISADFYQFCGEQPVPEIYNEYFTPANPIPDPLVGWDDPCCPEGDPDRLLAPPVVPIRVDDGQRTVMNIRYIEGSFVELANEDGMPECAGKRITFAFEVLSREQYLTQIEACEVNPGGEIDCCRCQSVTWAAEQVFAEPEQDCLVPEWARDLPSTTTELTTIDSPAPVINRQSIQAIDQAKLTKYSRPLSTTRVSCLTPVWAGDSADISVEISAGSATLANISVNIWEAATGWPNPTHPSGQCVYLLETALARAEIVHIPTGGTLTLDGRNSTETLVCNGVSNFAGRIVSTCGGSLFRYPTLQCGKRYWVSIDLDCWNPPAEDWSYRVSVHPKERVF